MHMHVNFKIIAINVDTFYFHEQKLSYASRYSKNMYLYLELPFSTFVYC